MTDGRPGYDGSPGNKTASADDDGWYILTRSDGTLELDVTCVRVDASGWVEFAGVVTAVSTPSVYVPGEVFLVSVIDGRQAYGVGDGIGMASHGLLSADPNALKKGCYAALDAKQYLRKGVISAGDIVVD